MTAKQYRDHLTKLGLTIVGAAPVLGISRRNSQRFAADGDVAEPVAKLLKLMVKFEVDPKDMVK